MPLFIFCQSLEICFIDPHYIFQHLEMAQLCWYQLQPVNSLFKYKMNVLNLVHHQKLKIHAYMVGFQRDLKFVIFRKVGCRLSFRQLFISCCILISMNCLFCDRQLLCELTQLSFITFMSRFIQLLTVFYFVNVKFIPFLDQALKL